MHSSPKRHPDIQPFLDTIAPCLAAYRHGVVSYVAMNHEGRWVLLRGRLELTMAPPSRLRPSFSTEHLLAVRRAWPPSADGLLSLIDQLLCATDIELGGYPVRFLAEAPGSPSAHTERPSRGLPGIARLVLSGVSHWQPLAQNEQVLEKELLEAEDSIGSLTELKGRFGFEPSLSSSLTFEIVAERVAEITDVSRVEGTRADIVLHVGPGIDRSRLRVALRGIDGGDAEVENLDARSSIEWRHTPAGSLGRFSAELTREAVISCRAAYAGTLQHEVELADPMHLPNPRRRLIEISDPGLAHLTKVLTAPRGDLRNQFEASIATLFYMLGFDTARPSASPQLSENSDIFGSLPEGDALVIECTTTGVLNHKDKLRKLKERLERAREALATPSSGIDVDRVIGVIVSPRSPDELSDRGLAEKYGLRVFCAPDIAAALKRTAHRPDAQAVLAAWRAEPLQRLMTHGLSPLRLDDV